ncbi:MAG: hypothetical protein H8E41_12670, partial [Desulfobulbaceae bacterium]|nr:hypothetical protein [Candidatus Desulfobia pelagia]
MGSVTGFPTPASVSSYIQQREISRRSCFFPVEPVSRIFRYGGAVASTIHYFPFLNRGMVKAREMIGGYDKGGKSFSRGEVVAAKRLESV